MRKVGLGSKNLGIIILFAVIILLPSCSIGYQEQRIAVPQATKVSALQPEVQGLYESCSPSRGSICFDRLKQMANAGFTLVVNYDQLYGEAEQELAYAKQAYSLGMKVIWGMSDPAFWNGTNLLNYYRDLAATCSCSDNVSFIHYTVNLVKNLPATWGYYVGDEVNKQDHDRMKAFADLVKQLDPSHPRLFVSSEDTSTMGANTVPFIDTADVIGADFYPIDTSEPVTAVAKIARLIQSIADRYGKQSMFVLQAFSYANYSHTWACSPFPGCARYPTQNEMRQMRDLAVNNAHLRFILWYSYFDILKSDNPSAHFKALVDAASAKLMPLTPH